MSTRYAVSVGAWEGESSPDGAFFADTGRQVEQLGFHGLYLGDHVVYPSAITECMTTLAYLAATTTRIMIGPMVLLLAMRPLTVSAKELATVDHLSGGRLIVGVGVGGEYPAEWKACGVPTHARGARTDEYLAVLPQLMRGEVVTHSGRFVELRGVSLNPPAVRQGGPPVWIGGRADAALARAARHDGWCAYAESPRGFARKCAVIDAARFEAAVESDFTHAAMVFARVGETREDAADALRPLLLARYGENFAQAMDRICAFGTQEDVAECVARYVEAGADEVIIAPMCSQHDWPEQVARLGAALSPQIPT